MRKILITTTFLMSLSGCAPDQWASAGFTDSNIVNQWISMGVTNPNDAKAWTIDGFTDYHIINEWISMGVTNPNDAKAWTDIDPQLSEDGTISGDMYFTPSHDFSYVAYLIKTGATPTTVLPVYKVVVAQNNDYDYMQDIVNIWPYIKLGYSPTDSLTYYKNNISPGNVPSYIAHQNELAEEARIAAKKMNDELDAAKAQCAGNTIDYNTFDLMNQNPFSITGKCFAIPIQVDQWVDSNDGLADSDEIFVQFPNDPPQNNFYYAIVRAGAPYQYTAVSGAFRTVPDVTVITISNTPFNQ